MFPFEGLDVQGDFVACWNGFEVVDEDAGIDGFRVGQWVAVLPVMKADVGGISAHSVNSVAPVLRAALREWRELHVDVSA